MSSQRLIIVKKEFVKGADLYYYIPQKTTIYISDVNVAERK